MTDPSERLNGWKEIASFLGKSVRSAQRWERELGLPVHRLGKEGGEIVFAFKPEIAAWMAATEAARASGEEPNGDIAPQPRVESTVSSGKARISWTRPRLILTCATAAAILALSWLALTTWSAPRGEQAREASAQPALWRVEDNRLTVMDDGGKELWRRRFDEGLVPHEYRRQRGTHASVFIADLDADGESEVIFLQRSRARHGRRLHVFNGDGSTRFVRQPAPSVRFGETTYDPPWPAHYLNVTRNAAGVSNIWVAFTHGMWFPTLLQQLDKDGATTAEYWNNGYVQFVESATWGGRPVVLVGGTNNEHRAASLAIFDAGGVGGAAPASNPQYRCTSCPPGAPLAFVVFPRLCMKRVEDGQPFVDTAWIDGEDRIVVVVDHGEAQLADGKPVIAHVYYTLGAGLAPVRVELSREFHLAHSLLEEGGALDHAFGETDEQDLFPLLRWDGAAAQFIELPRAPVTH